jgi:hypothetical protein
MLTTALPSCGGLRREDRALGAAPTRAASLKVLLMELEIAQPERIWPTIAQFGWEKSLRYQLSVESMSI